MAIEACFGSSNVASERRRLTGVDACQAYPGDVAQLKRCADTTDFGDARLLADQPRASVVPVVWLTNLDTRQLRKLVRFRRGLVRDGIDVKP